MTTFKIILKIVWFPFQILGKLIEVLLWIILAMAAVIGLSG